MIRVGIIDDHQLYTDALSSILKIQQEISEVCVLNNPHQSTEWLLKEKPEVVLLDMMMPEINGINLIPKLKAEKTKVIVVTSRSNRKLMRLCLTAGANGFCSKNTDVTELLLGIRKVVNGQVYISNNLKESTLGDTKLRPQLSNRETEVLEHLSKGLSSREIADLLFITEHTVNSHRKNLLKKFKCNTTAQMLHKLVMSDEDYLG